MGFSDRSRMGEGAQGLDQEAYDVGDGFAGLELHFDGVDDGDELALGVETEPHDQAFDGLDHTEGFRVPPGDLVQIVVVRGHGSECTAVEVEELRS